MGVGIGREGERWRLIGGLPGQAKVLAGGLSGFHSQKVRLVYSAHAQT